MQPAIDGPGPPIASDDRAEASGKRSFDYGAELKGLTDDEEVSQLEHGSSPVAKRPRLHRSGSESSSGSLDDGEVIEADPTSAATSGEQQESSASSDEGQLRGAPPSKSGQQSSFGWNRGLSLGTRTSFGQARATKLATAKATSTPLLTKSPSSSPEPSDIVEAATQAEETGNGRRKSVASTAGTSTTAPEEAAAASDGAGKSHSFRAAKRAWKLPRRRATEFPDSNEVLETSFWTTKINLFVLVLVQENFKFAHKLNKSAMRTGLESYLAHKNKTLPGEKKHRNLAKDTMTKALSGISDADFNTMVEAARNKVQKANTDGRDAVADAENGVVSPNVEKSEPAADNVSAPVSIVDSDAESGQVDDSDEYHQQEMYFPGAEDPSKLCLGCSAPGHQVKDCPHRACRFCEGKDHTEYGCPTKIRCEKCQQTGHGKEDCMEKLALADDERDDNCVICGASGHIEQECNNIWRSFDPLAMTLSKVKDIPVFCYNCGNEGHYGPECGLLSRRPDISSSKTWSMSNRDQYVDPETDEVAIAWISVEGSAATNGAPSSSFQIRGRASKSTHTHFVSSDDSDDDEFIHEPIRKGPNKRGGVNAKGRGGGNGAIRISTNIASARRNSDGAQPPLPPGPPPPLPSTYPPPPPPSQRGGPHSLPPRPGGGNNPGHGLPPKPQGGGGGNRSSHSAPRGRGGGGGGRGFRGRGRGGRGFR